MALTKSIAVITGLKDPISASQKRTVPQFHPPSPLSDALFSLNEGLCSFGAVLRPCLLKYIFFKFVLSDHCCD